MQTAGNWARTRLKHKHEKEYRVLYLEALGDRRGKREFARARCEAISKLVSKYREEYLELREEAAKLGFSRSNSMFKAGRKEVRE